ncbi:MAG: serine/threonine protein kinase [Sandaracinaceae bacterium]|nr:serine/threonine protein kinase [Sandaracinaceae bacterium]MBP7682790.1 serine/threonine protein kinase [Deltaproteobacteria bacterium]
MRICPRCGLKYPNDQSRCFVDNATLEQTADPWLGQTLAGRYLIEEMIGEGGMATVYRARHTLVDRPVAVKIMAPHLRGSEQLAERFRREAKNAAALSHPNIIEIHDHGETAEGGLFMVMELLRGRPLADLVAAGPMNPADVCAYGLQIATGLARAHDFDVLHRDLKPDNIFICDGPPGTRGTAKLLDFGIGRSMGDSRLTNAGEIFGTPQYMAPERLTNIDAGASADLYALGCILFEMITGRPPFESQEITGYFIKHMQEPPPRPSSLAPACPRRLEELILALLEKKPEQRPVDAHALIHTLQELAPKDDAPGPAPIHVPSRPQVAPTLPPTTLERWARRTAIFDQMLTRAFPGGDAPAALRAQLEEIREMLRTIQNLRTRGLGEQRKLETLDHEARENRARMGHAMHVLAEDLSSARTAARSAETDVAPYFTAEKQAETAVTEAYERLAAGGGLRPPKDPAGDVQRLLRELADGLDRWQLARGASEKARAWLDGKRQEVTDLDFQVKSMREVLERTETTMSANKAASEQALMDSGRAVEDFEQRLLVLAGHYCEGLRMRPELGDLFQQLETQR